MATVKTPPPSRAPEDAPRSVIDTSRMSAGQRAALEATEAARSLHREPGFMADLFMGRWRPRKLARAAPVDVAESARAERWLDELAAFLQARVDPDEIDRTGEIPDAVLAGLAELGAYGIKIPVTYGGLGFSQQVYLRACTLLGSHCANVFAHLSVHQSVGVPQPVMLFGTEEQRHAWLPRVAAGEVSAFALTEPGVGSDPARLTTRAEPAPDGEHFILNGEKLWCSNGTRAGLLVVVAKTPPKLVDGRQRDQLTAFVVEAHAAGVELVHRCQFMGLRALYNGVLRFTNVRVPRGAILGGEGRGLKVALTTLNAGRLSIPASSLGVMKKALQIAREWCGERVQWGRPIGEHDAIAQKVRWIAAHTFGLEAMLALTARIVDADKQADIRLEAAYCKLWGTEKAWEALDHLMQLRGGRGYETVASLRARGEKAPPVERMMRDARVTRIFEGSSEIMRLFIMREALDPHLQAAGEAVHSQLPWGRRARAAVRAGGFYGVWYPSTWLPAGVGVAGSDPRLARRLAGVARRGRRMARALFYLMLRHGPALERRQALLGRVADVGGDLFAMAAACLYARERIAAGEDAAKVIAVVDDLCALAGERIEQNFRGLRHNTDAAGYALAQQVVAGEQSWLEGGIV